MAEIMGNIAVLMGGTSAERQVSLASGKAIAAALEARGHNVEAIDLTEHYLSQIQRLRADQVMIALHGGFGENGEIQALLEAYHLPYTGSSTLTCALTMDKAKTKYLLQGMGIKTAPFVEMTEVRLLSFDECKKRLGLPLFVKPATEGSSIGISKVTQAQEFSTALEKAFSYASRILVEAFLPGEEYTVAWLQGNALPAIRIETQSEYYDYDAKYITGTTSYHLPSGLNDTREKHLQKLAENVADAVGLHTWGRVDFIEDAQGEFNVVEVNTVPGMTQTSLVPKAARSVGIEFDELVERILEGAALKNRYQEAF